MGCSSSKEKNTQPDIEIDQQNKTNTSNHNNISTKKEASTNEVLTTQTANTNNSATLKALFDFKARAEEDLTISKNDNLILIDDSDENWWYCRNTETGKEGYVPSNHVAKEKADALEEWFFGDIKRQDAENMILGNGSKGCFLVRNAESSTGCYSLSVCDGNEQVKHYRIRKLDNGNYCITTMATFPTLNSLIDYYRKNSSGLCCCLSCSPSKSTPETFGLSKNTWEEPRENFRLTKRLGAGQFGEVWEAVYKGSTLVAIKTLKPGTMSPKEFLDEANIMKRLRHPNLVQLLAVCTDGEPLYIVAEYMKNGSLLSYLPDNKVKVNQRHMVDMACQIANGMACLEQNKFIHRDLAARNILVSYDLKYKVADFGLARITQDNEYEASEKSKFPIKWTAPEAALYHKFSTKSDVWSYGILLYEIVTYGQTPYPGMSNLETIQKVSDGYRQPCPTKCNKEIYSIMLKCWHEDAEKRPSFDYLKNYFEDFSTSNETRYTDM